MSVPVPQNEITYERDFWKDVHGLPHAVQGKLAGLIIILRNNPFDPLLHTKRLNPPLQEVFSLRITRDYRVGFMFDASHAIRLLIAGKRDQIYKRLERKIK